MGPVHGQRRLADPGRAVDGGDPDGALPVGRRRERGQRGKLGASSHERPRSSGKLLWHEPRTAKRGCPATPVHLQAGRRGETLVRTDRVDRLYQAPVLRLPARQIGRTGRQAGPGYLRVRGAGLDERADELPVRQRFPGELVADRRARQGAVSTAGELRYAVEGR
jgi:hypothetical protein